MIHDLRAKLFLKKGIKLLVKLLPMDGQPFKPWPAQERLWQALIPSMNREARRTIKRINCCKSRQVGITEAALAWLFWVCLTNPGAQVGIAFHIDQSKLKTLRRLREWEDNHKIPVAKDEVLFTVNDRGVKFSNGSSLAIASAGGATFRGQTFDALVLSEFAFYNEDPTSWMEETLEVKRGTLLVETTPNLPAGFHKDLCNKVDGWEQFRTWWHENPSSRITPPPGWVCPPDLRIYSPEAACWYDTKRRAATDLHQFRLNNPSNDAECFALAGGGYIDPMALSAIASSVWRPVPPVKGHSYVIGADVASGKGLDFSVAAVIDLHTNQLVEVLRDNKIEEGEFGNKIALLAARYNRAPCIIEENVGQLCIARAREAGANVRPFRTTVTSKRKLLQQLREAVTQGLLVSLPPSFLDELGTLIIPPGEINPRASGNAHDDTVIALALAIEGVRTLTPPTITMASPALSSPALVPQTPAASRYNR